MRDTVMKDTNIRESDMWDTDTRGMDKMHTDMRDNRIRSALYLIPSVKINANFF